MKDNFPGYGNIDCWVFSLLHLKYFTSFSACLQNFWREVGCNSYLQSSRGKVRFFFFLILWVLPSFFFFLCFIFWSLNMMCLGVVFLVLILLGILWVSLRVSLELPQAIHWTLSDSTSLTWSSPYNLSTPHSFLILKSSFCFSLFLECFRPNFACNFISSSRPEVKCWLLEEEIKEEVGRYWFSSWNSDLLSFAFSRLPGRHEF